VKQFQVPLLLLLLPHKYSEVPWPLEVVMIDHPPHRTYYFFPPADLQIVNGQPVDVPAPRTATPVNRLGPSPFPDDRPSSHVSNETLPQAVSLQPFFSDNQIYHIEPSILSPSCVVIFVCHALLTLTVNVLAAVATLSHNEYPSSTTCANLPSASVVSDKFHSVR